MNKYTSKNANSITHQDLDINVKNNGNAELMLAIKWGYNKLRFGDINVKNNGNAELMFSNKMGV
jgi:hypothetical protein